MYFTVPAACAISRRFGAAFTTSAVTMGQPQPVTRMSIWPSTFSVVETSLSSGTLASVTGSGTRNVPDALLGDGAAVSTEQEPAP